jgi:hypothetical protein
MGVRWPGEAGRAYLFGLSIIFYSHRLSCSETGIEEAFSLACHFDFIVPHDVIHVLPAWSAPAGVSVFTSR